MKEWRKLARVVCAWISAFMLGHIARQALKGDQTHIAQLAVIGFAAIMCLIIWLAVAEGD